MSANASRNDDIVRRIDRILIGRCEKYSVASINRQSHRRRRLTFVICADISAWTILRFKGPEPAFAFPPSMRDKCASCVSQACKIFSKDRKWRRQRTQKQKRRKKFCLTLTFFFSKRLKPESYGLSDQRSFKNSRTAFVVTFSVIETEKAKRNQCLDKARRHDSKMFWKQEYDKMYCVNSTPL